MKSFCKSVLYFVSYGQLYFFRLLEHARKQKWRNFRILDISFLFCLFGSFSLTSKGFPSSSSRNLCLPALRKLRTYDFVLKLRLTNTPRRHRQAEPALITFTALAKFQLVWRRLFEALLSSSSLAPQTHPSSAVSLCLTLCRRYNKKCRSP